MLELSRRPAKLQSVRVYEDLLQRIATCEIEPGDMVFESSLAEDYGVSKTPVREALLRLCHEGFVERYPHVGYKVTKASLKDVRDGYRIRALLEGEAAALAAHTMGEEELDMLEEIVERMEVADNTQLIALNKEFHTAVARASGNQRLAHMISLLYDDLDRVFVMDPQILELTDEGVDSERVIIEAIRSGDPDIARQAMERHIDESLMRIRQLL